MEGVMCRREMVHNVLLDSFSNTLTMYARIGEEGVYGLVVPIV
jgi:hypothetical protein